MNKATRLLLVVILGICGTFFGLAALGNSGLLDTASPPESNQVIIPSITSPSSTDNQATIAVTEDTGMIYAEQIAQALDAIPLVIINDVGVFDISGRIQVVFAMVDNNLDIAEDHMKKIACAIKEVGTTGYDLRLAGENRGGGALVTATISEAAVNNLDCGVMSVIDWASVADEYNVAAGLR